MMLSSKAMGLYQVYAGLQYGYPLDSYPPETSLDADMTAMSVVPSTIAENPSLHQLPNETRSALTTYIQYEG